MDSHGKDELIKLSVVVCKMVFPYILDVSGIAGRCVSIQVDDDGKSLLTPSHGYSHCS
jgi:hypothetical protein